MALIRDNDDERRARVEALICELLRPRDHASEPDAAIAPRDHTSEHASVTAPHAAVTRQRLVL